MRPSRRLLQILFGLMVSALLLALLRLWLRGGEYSYLGSSLTTVWWSVSVVVIGLALLDCLFLRYRNPLKVDRNLPGSFAVGAGNQVTLHFENTTSFNLTLDVADHCPPQINSEGLPATIKVAPNTATELRYMAHPTERGDAVFSQVDTRIQSRTGLWDFRYRYPLVQKVNVYPNFTAIAKLEQLGHDQQMSQVGIHIMQRRGQGMDFHQLREYRDGDTSRQIDWKASSRYRKFISREYQDEKDQDIVFLLDCGRRMRTKDDELSHFDHCLNSLLLVSYVALRQGDAVGLMSFAGEDRWLSPVKGKTNINAILNSVYNLQSSTDTSDLSEAANQLMTRHRKRSLVIVVSNLREEDREDVIAATKLLSKKHLVLVASLRENFLDTVIENPIDDFESSLVYSETVDLLTKRRRLLETLRGSGVIVTDSVPQKLHIQLINEYWALKRSGRI